MRVAALATMISCCAIGLASAADDAAAIARTTRIPAQALEPALQVLAQQCDLQVVYRSEVVGELRTAGALGELEAGEALAQLLRDTGLTYQYLDRNTVTIVPIAAAAPAAAGGGASGEQGAQYDVDRLVDEVIVSARRATTATKTEVPLVETPQAISVITADQFLDQGALNFDDTLRYVSGVTGETYGLDSRNASVFIRGMDAAEYLDGMRRIFGYVNFARTDVYTLDRVEVLRGPSSVLYGAGGAGGLVNQVSKRPRFERFAELGLQFGSYERRQLQFDTGGPFGDSDKWAARLVGVAREADTQVDFVPDDRLLLMPSLTWRPGERTSVTLIAQWREDRLGQTAQFPPLVASLQAPAGRRLPDSFFGGEPDYNDYDVDQQTATLLIDHRFSDAVSFSSGLRYTYSRTATDNIFVDSFSSATDPFIDADDEVLARFYFDTIQRAKALTTDQKLQIDFRTGPFTHQLLAGVDYQSFRQVTDSASGDAPPLNIYHPVYGSTLQRELGRDPTQRQSQFGFYLQDQIAYADRLHLVLGARRDRARSHSQGTDQQVDNVTTFRAAFIVNGWNGLSPYVSYAESFLPVASTGYFGQIFVPQEGIQYEAGVKWQPRPETLLTFAAFDLRDTHRFTNHPTDAFLVVQQGEVRARGIELEASHTFFDSFEVIASFTDFDAQISKSNEPAEIGLPLDAVPGRMASAWGVKRFNIGADAALRLGAGVRYMGESFSSGSLRIPSYTLLDALIAAEWGQRWSVSLNATSLADKRHYATCLARGDCWPGARRYVVATANYRY